MTHVYNRVDPKEDLQIIETELALADLQTLEKRRARFDKEIRGEKPANSKAHERLKVLYAQLHEALSAGKPARSVALSGEDSVLLRDLHLLTLKPMFYALNVSEVQLRDYAATQQLLEPLVHADHVVPFSAQIESEIAQLPDEEQTVFLKEFGLTQSSLDRIIAKGYELLGLITFFTAGPKEVRAWTLRRGLLAPQAAGVIHTDFEHGFIRAEIISYADYIAGHGEEGARANGKLRIEGKEYAVQDGDVVHFRFSV